MDNVLILIMDYKLRIINVLMRGLVDLIISQPQLKDFQLYELNINFNIFKHRRCVIFVGKNKHEEQLCRSDIL